MGVMIAICNNKGGVGKSSISCNLAHCLAIKGKRVLVIDLDPQANSTSLLLPDTEITMSLHTMYKDGVSAAKCIYPSPYELVDILPNVNKTAALEMDMYQDVKKSYFILRDKTRDIVDNYDVIICDCPPNLGLFVVMALVASDCAIVPIVSGSRFSLEGFSTAFDAIEAISKNLNKDLKFLKAVINKVDKRTSISRIAVEHINRQFGDRVFATTINTNTDIERAEFERQTVTRFNPQSTGARKFRALAEELIECLAGV